MIELLQVDSSLTDHFAAYGLPPGELPGAVNMAVRWATGSVFGGVCVTLIALAKFRAFPWQRAR
jgi:hypothetical protein